MILFLPSIYFNSVPTVNISKECSFSLEPLVSHEFFIPLKISVLGWHQKLNPWPSTGQEDATSPSYICGSLLLFIHCRERILSTVSSSFLEENPASPFQWQFHLSWPLFCVPRPPFFPGSFQVLPNVQHCDILVVRTSPFLDFSPSASHWNGGVSYVLVLWLSSPQNLLFYSGKCVYSRTFPLISVLLIPKSFSSSGSFSST